MSARVHGRVQVCVLCLKAVLCLGLAVNIGSRAAVEGALCLAAVVYLSAYVVYLPFYSLRCNQIHVAYGSVFAWATFCFVVKCTRNNPFVSPSPLLLSCVVQHVSSSPAGPNVR